MLGQWVDGIDDGIEYEVRRFKGTFGLESKYTGFGPEADAAWDNITESKSQSFSWNLQSNNTKGPTGGAIGVTREQWEAVNPFSESAVTLEKDRGTGNYLASLDVFHQLHCVDLLRKSLHRDYYNEHEGSFAGSSEFVVQGHLGHCIETLRQTIMCHGDVSLLTYNWVKGRDMPYPNFNTVHKCKKWDKLVAWNRDRDVTWQWELGNEHQLSIPTKPSGVVPMETPP
ncbi:hypothetical protein EK21DRAFT_115363 [Setomelanomma holmii]|uniref:Tat pathway signal sequence n=1 Tax=Setomelanomma holmii TaxID=210430 RepID=A0A9P4LJ47_9PLEO|nr:hypothetical protein EK21DRAFT_115363 [Setomelanomma holmii]